MAQWFQHGEYILRVDGGFSKDRTKDRSSAMPLVQVIMSTVTIHASSVPILNQFPSGSIDVNLGFWLSDKR